MKLVAKKLNRCALFCLSLTAATLAVPALAGGSHGSHGTIPENGRFSENSPGGTWPPQPRNITNEQQFTPGTSKQTASTSQSGTRTGKSTLNQAMQAATMAASTNPAVLNLLGTRYAHIATNPINGKWQDLQAASSDRFTVIFYSHSNNQTVEVTIEGGVVDEVHPIVASISQPPLAQSEKTEAIALARSWWQNQGNATVNNLEGFAIQTYQSSGDFFGSRMIYVSFHPSSDQLPQLLTWVDLTHQQVIRGEVGQ